MTNTLLHLAPHCDDELIGAPATLLSLRDAGWRVVNLVSSLGTPVQAARRRAEVEEACRRAGFELIVADPPLGDPLSASEIPAARALITDQIEGLANRLDPDLLVAPSPHDRHPGHEAVGRAVVVACERRHKPVPLWLWGLWADLPFPTLAVAFGNTQLDEIITALAAHAGELVRNDYRKLVRGRAEANASLGPERVFGFGSGTHETEYAEVITEAIFDGRRWRLGAPRWLDAKTPLPHPVANGRDITDWLHSPSLTDLYGPPG